jgi:uncharacterized protein YqeY
MRDRINADVKTAMKSGDKERLATLRLITAALKDRELGIGHGAPAGGGALSEADILQVLQRMVKQRRDSIEQYRAGNRADLAAKEEAEIAVIEGYLPQQMDEAQMAAAIAAAIAETGAASVKDMGKVMGVLKQRHGAVMDFGKASGLVKAKLAGG